MKSNNVFTYVLYALLGVLLLSVGYLALEKRKETARKEAEMQRDREQLERSLADLNSVGDSTTAGQSAYVGESSTAKSTTTKVSKDGIEDESTPGKKAATTVSKPVARQTTPTTSTTTKTVTPVTTSKGAPAPVTSAKGLVAKGGTAAGSKQSVAPSNNGRYFVVVGAFSQIENARTEMEKFVKMGYQNAEVIKYKNDLWRVVAKRCSKRSDAVKYEGDLERQGIDAMVVDGK